jgi:hypothetical protein
MGSKFCRLISTLLVEIPDYFFHHRSKILACALFEAEKRKNLVLEKKIVKSHSTISGIKLISSFPSEEKDKKVLAKNSDEN